MNDREIFDLAVDALNAAVAGDVGAAADILTRVHGEGPRAVAVLLAALAQAGKSKVEAVSVPLPEGALWSVQSLPGTVPSCEPADLFAQRFFSAYMNTDHPMGITLLQVLLDQGWRAAAEGTMALMALVVSLVGRGAASVVVLDLPEG